MRSIYNIVFTYKYLSMKKEKKTVEMQPEIKSFFKAQIKAEWWTPSIVEVDYIWADWETHKWLQFEGYASTNDLDRTNDVVMPEAFESSIQEYMKGNPIILLQHNHDDPVWSIIEATIDAKWLFIKGIIKIDRDNLFQSIRTWVIKTMSFWYRINDYEQESKIDAEWNTIYYNVIKSLEIFEISVVSVPMNAQAQFKSAKELLGLEDDEYKKHFEINKKDEYPLLQSINDIMAKNVTEEVKEKTLSVEDNIEKQLRDLVEVKLWIKEDWPNNWSVYVVWIFEWGEFVFNHYKYAEQDNYDLYMRWAYEEKEWSISLIWEFTEVEAKTERVDKMKAFREENIKSLEEKEIEADEINEEVVDDEKNAKEPKEAIENPKNTETVDWDVDTEADAKETTENVETEEEAEVVVEDIEKAVDSKEFVEQKSFDEKSKSIDELLSTKANAEDVNKLLEEVKSLTKSNEDLVKENETSVKAYSGLLEMIMKNQKALQRITLDGAMSYKQEPEVKANPLLNTKLAKKLAAIKN